MNTKSEKILIIAVRVNDFTDFTDFIDRLSRADRLSRVTMSHTQQQLSARQ